MEASSVRTLSLRARFKPRVREPSEAGCSRVALRPACAIAARTNAAMPARVPRGADPPTRQGPYGVSVPLYEDRCCPIIESFGVEPLLAHPYPLALGQRCPYANMPSSPNAMMGTITALMALLEAFPPIAPRPLYKAHLNSSRRELRADVL